MVRKAYDCYMLHNEAGRNAKVRKVLRPEAERLAFFLGVLAIAAKSDERGSLLVGPLPADEVDVAEQAGVTVRVARAAMGKLRDAGMLFTEDGCEWVHDFDDYNPPPKKDNTNAERQERFRKARNAGRNAPGNAPSNAVTKALVTPPVTPPVTPTKPLRNANEVEVEVEELPSLGVGINAAGVRETRPVRIAV